MKLRKLLPLVLCVLLALCLAQASAENSCGNGVTWSLVSGRLTISGAGAISDFASAGAAPWASQADTITALEVQSGVTGIGSYAFADLTKLTAASLPSSLRRIGSRAFENTALASVTVPKNVTRVSEGAFAGCAQLASVGLPAGLTAIEPAAFADCASLGVVALPRGTATVAARAFDGCDNLEEILIPDTVTFIGSGAVPANATIVGDADSYAKTYADANGIPFRALNTIASGTAGVNTRWTIDETGCMTVSGTGAITDASGWAGYVNRIKTVNIESGVTSVCASAFANCASLARAEIADTVGTIQSGAFPRSTLIVGAAGGAVEAYAVQNGNAFLRNDVLLAEPCGENADCVLLKSGELIISGTGDLYAAAVWADRAADIRTASVGAGVTSVPAYAFEGCANLESVTLSDTVAVIGANAFANCAKLTAVKIPSGVTSVGAYAFSGCTALTGVAIETAAADIAWNCFDGCSALNDFSVSEGNTAYSCAGGALLSADGGKLIRVPCARTDYTVPETVKEIGDGAFEACAGLVRVTIPKTVTAIGKNAFALCGEGLTIYGENGSYAQAFANSNGIPFEVIGVIASGECGANTAWTLTSSGMLTISGSGAIESAPWLSRYASITAVNVEAGVASIPANAFEGCSAITSVTLNAGLASIGEGAFNGCTSLTSIVVPNGVTQLGARAFAQCSRLESAILPSGLAVIGEYTFADCAKLSALTLPSGLRVIGRYAFTGCMALKSVVLPEGAVAIDNNAFIGCSTLADLYIPASVTSIASLGKTAGLTIHGFADTAASRYAAAHGIPFDPMGAATSGSCGANAAWRIDSFGRLTVSGSGAINDYNRTAAPWAERAADIRSVVIESGITKIGASAFKGCANLETAQIADTVSAVAADAFANCGAKLVLIVGRNSAAETYAKSAGIAYRYADVLAQGENWTLDLNGRLSVTGSGAMQTGWAAWHNQITSVEIASGITTIADSAFRDCDSLTEIVIPNGVTRIGAYAFAYCDALRSVTVPHTVTEIADTAFFNDGAEKRNLTICGTAGSAAQTFAAAHGIAFSADGVQDSGECGADVRWSLGTNGTLTVSGAGAMRSYAATGAPWYPLRGRINRLVVESGVTTIGSNAFNGCTALTRADIPGSVVSVGSNAFAGANRLVISCDVGTGIFAYASECGIAVDIVAVPESKRILKLPSSLYAIGDAAFRGDAAIEVVIVPAATRTIGASAFADCKKLYRVEIPSGVTGIDPSAFNNCPQVTIVCAKGSAAEAYAIANRLPYAIR